MKLFIATVVLSSLLFLTLAPEVFRLILAIFRLWYFQFRAWLALRKMKRQHSEMVREIAILKDVIRESKRRNRRIAKLQKYMPPPDSYKPSHWTSYGA
jgi:hypothetical protein